VAVIASPEEEWKEAFVPMDTTKTLDIVICPIWLGITLLLARASWAVGRRLFPQEGVLAHVLHTTVLFWACLVGTTLLLGSTGFLTRWTLLGCILVITVLMLKANRSAYYRALKLAPTSSSDTVIKKEGTTLAQSDDRSSHPAAGESIWFILWLIALAWVVSRQVLKGLLKFPSNFDTLTYHLPVVVQWLRRGSLYVPDDAQWSVPGNNEVIGLWLVTSFSGDFLIALNNLPAVILLAVAAVELGTIVGLTRSLSHLWGIAALFTTPFLLQMFDCENDLAVAGLFLACLCYGVRFACHGQRADLALFGLSVGLLAGVKYYALGYAAVAGSGLLLLTLARRGWRTAALAVSLSLLGGLLLGSYWYARNWWMTGTPLYPRGFTSNTNLQGQIHADLWRTTLLGNPHPEKFALLLRALWRMGGPCQWLAFYVLPFTIAWMIASWIWFCDKGNATSGVIRITLTFWTVAAGFVWAVTPFMVETVPGTLNMLAGGYSPVRFGLCFLSLALLCLVAMVQDVGRGIHHLLVSALPSLDSRRAMRYLCLLLLRLFATAPVLVLTGAVIYQLEIRIHPTTDKMETALLAANLLLIGTSIVLFLRMWRWPQLLCSLTLTAVLVGATIGINWLAYRWHANFAAHYDVTLNDKLYVRLSQMDPSETKICVLGYRYYPFFGSRRQFRVSRPLWLPTYDSFLQYLHDHDATLVAAVRTIDPGVRRYADGRNWLKEHPDIFELVQDGPQYLVCRVNRDGLARALASR
jgi:hypothetical protein